MTAANTSVKYFHSMMTGAPTVDAATPGQLIAVLDACLVNGFGSKNVDSVSVVSGICTLALSTGVGAIEPDVVVLVAGCSNVLLNGEKRVISTTANSVTYDATGVADSSPSGTVTVKLAPAGWDRPFSGANLAVYRSPDVTGTRFFMRVDDSVGAYATMVCYESMNDVNTGVNKFPTDVQRPTGFTWRRGSPPDNGAAVSLRSWIVVADSKTMYLFVNGNAGSGNKNEFQVGCIWTFGDFISTKSGDPYCCLATGIPHTDAYNWSAVNSHSMSFCTIDASPSYAIIPRSFTGIGGPVSVIKRAEGMLTNTSYSGSINNSGSYPNACDNALHLCRVVLQELTPYTTRGYSRGILFATQNCHAAFSGRDKVEGAGPYSGRKLMAVKGVGDYYNSTQNSQGVMFFDITGPWG